MSDANTVAWLSGDTAIHDAVERWLDGTDAGVTLRDNPRRRLVRLEPKGLPPLLVKHFRTGSHHRVREVMKAWLGRSPADREARHLQSLHALGVPVPEPLALGRLAAGDRLLILPFLDGGAGAPALSPDLKTRALQLRRLGEAVRALHAAGFAHGDLHAGNVLFQAEGAVLLDLQHARRSDRLTDRLRDLGELDYSFWGRGSAADRLRIRRAALAIERARSRGDSRRLLQEVGAAAREKAWRHGNSRTRRLMRTGRQTAKLRNRRGQGLHWRDFEETWVDLALRAHEDALERNTALVLKRDARSQMTRVQVGGQSLVVKEILTRSAGRAIADRLRGSGAWRGWRAGHGLRARGIRAALPLATLDERRFGVPVRSWLIVEDLAPAVDLLEQAPGRQAAIVRGLGPWLARLHARGVDHGDLKATHLFLEKEGAATDPILVDVDGVRFLRRLPDPLRRQALAELNASLPDSWPAAGRCEAFQRYVTTECFDIDPQRALKAIIDASLERRHRWTGADCDLVAKVRPAAGQALLIVTHLK